MCTNGNFVLVRKMCAWFIILLFCFNDVYGVVNPKKKFQMRFVNRSEKINFPDSQHIIFPSVSSDETQNPPVVEVYKRRNLTLDPCAEFVPPRPRFSSKTIRISDLKCAEYLSQMVNREIVSDRAELCRIKRGNISLNKTRISIISNHETRLGQYPHMAALGWRSRNTNKFAFLCGGSLISPNFVLTAAHCTSRSDRHLFGLEPEIVRLGTRDIVRSRYEKPIDVKIKKLHLHPMWDSPKRYYDIALVELERPVEFSKFVQPACLSGKYYKSRHNVTVTGWGVADIQTLRPSSVLRQGRVDIIDSKFCDSLFDIYHDRNWWGLMDHQICAGKIEGGVDTCQGDSGGPLQVMLKETRNEGTMHMVIGVTSFGVQRKCGVEKQPGIYTKVSSFLDWIESVVWPVI